MPPKAPANLIVRPEKLGDLVVATPVFRAFKETFPDQPLHLLTDDRSAAVVERDPHLDRIIRLPWYGHQCSQRPSWRSTFESVRASGPYQRAAILYPSEEGWNWILALNRVPHVAQLGGTFSALLLGHACVLRKNHVEGRHMSDLFLSVAEKLGAVTADSCPRLYVGEEERAAILARFPSLREPGKIFVHAFSVSTAPNLSPRSYFALCSHLAAGGRRVYLVGTRSELEGAGLPPPPGISTELVGALNLRELMAACSQADLVIGGSSGVVHLAAALGVPTLALQCPHANHHLTWGPRGPWSKTLAVPSTLCRRMGAVTGPCQFPAPCDIAFGFSPEQIGSEAERLILSRIAGIRPNG